MYVTRAWYWAAWSDELKGAPVYRQLLGLHVAMYRASNGEVYALNAVCPHRGANLGKGRIEGDCIRCPFHGLKFSRDGRCVEVPSQPPGESIPPRAVVATYPVVERDGIVWIWPNTEIAPSIDPPESDWLRPGRSEYAVARSQRLQQGDFVITTETAIEDSHVSFIHPRSLGITTPRVPRYLIEEHEDGWGFTARYDPDSPWWVDTDVPDTRRVRDYASFRRYVDYSVVWRLGSQLAVHIVSPTGWELHATAFVTPSEEGNVWFALATSRSNRTVKEKAANLLERIWPRTLGGGRVADEDEWATSDLILEKHPGGLERPVFTQSDVVCVAFRRIYQRHLRLEQNGEVADEREALLEETASVG